MFLRFFYYFQSIVDSESALRLSTTTLSNVSADESSLELRDVEQEEGILDELDISKYLVLKKPEEDGPDIRGGQPDALLIHATKANKHGSSYC